MTTFEEYTAGLVEGARETSGVEGLVLLGSASAAGADRRDAWSDHDFSAVLHPDDAVDLRATLAFLPFRDRIVLTAAEAAREVVAQARRHLGPGWPQFPSALADVVEQRMAAR